VASTLFAAGAWTAGVFRGTARSQIDKSPFVIHFLKLISTGYTGIKQ
jgi:hypothetical protein